MDPTNGRIKITSRTDFIKKWTKVLILLEPTSSLKKGNFKTSNLSRFSKLFFKYKHPLILTIVASLTVSITNFTAAAYVQNLFDVVIPNSDKNLLNTISVLSFILIICNSIVSLFRSIVITHTSRLIDEELISSFLHLIIHRPFSFHENTNTGEITSRISDAAKIRKLIGETIPELFLNFITLLISSFILVFLSKELTYILLLNVPLYTIIYYFTNRLNKKHLRKTMEKASIFESQLLETLDSIQNIKFFGLEEHFSSRTIKKLQSFLNSSLKSYNIQIYTTFASSLLNQIVSIALLWFGASLLFSGRITIGGIFSFYLIQHLFFDSIRSLILSNSTLRNALIASDRLYEFLETPIKSASKVKIEIDNSVTLKIHNANFSYKNGTQVLKGFSLDICPGQITAIVGESGCGKTTLASILLNAYSLDSGDVYINDRNFSVLENETIQNHISILPQKISLFSDTIIQNIVLNDPLPDMEKVENICRIIGLESYISSLPNGLETVIGERGITLSGGQRQKIAFARVIYKNTPIIVLDEPTSHLDTASEKQVISSIANFRIMGKTVILITHKPNNISIADRIVLMKEGKIIQEETITSFQESEGPLQDFWYDEFSLIK